MVIGHDVTFRTYSLEQTRSTARLTRHVLRRPETCSTLLISLRNRIHMRYCAVIGALLSRRSERVHAERSRTANSGNATKMTYLG